MNPTSTGAKESKAQTNGFEKDLCAVIVTFFPTRELLHNIALLRPQVGHVLIVDNGSDSDACRSLLESLEKVDGVSVHYNGANLGMGAALNVGARFALEHGFKWLATFDQDSTAPAGYMNGLFDALVACPYKDEVALVAARYQDKVCTPVYVKSYAGRVTNTIFAPIEITMTSGNIVRTDVFKTVGFFDETFFIDFLDYEFCLRLRSNGFALIEAQQTVLMHRCGERTTHRFFWRLVRTTNYQPLRRYYSMRNRVAVYKRYWRAQPRWVIGDMVLPLRDILTVYMFESDPGPKIRAMLKGAWHGFRGKMGKAHD